MDTTAAWAVALDRFRGGYGGEADLDNQTDRFLFLELLTYEIRAQLEPEVRAKIKADMAAFFYAEAEKVEAETRIREASRGVD